MSALFSGGPDTPTYRQVNQATPKQEDEATTNAANATLLRRRLAYGQSKTMLTSSDMGTAPTNKKTLLGE